MELFKMAKEAMAMRGKLSEMEKILKSKVFEVNADGLTVKVNGKSEFLEIKLTPELLAQGPDKVEKKLLSCIQQAVKKSQDAMAEEAKKVTGGMKIPGLN